MEQLINQDNTKRPMNYSYESWTRIHH